MGFLKLIGAVSAAEHKELRDLLTTVSRERNDALIAAGEADEQFKLAISDLAKSREEVAAYKEGAKALHRGLDDYMAEIDRLHEEIAALRPDAEAMRKKRRDDVERGQAKRDAAKGAGK